MDESNKPAFSFGFTKRTEVKKLQSSAIKDNDHDKKEETDYLVSVEDNEIKSAKPVVEKAPLVIPLIQQNRWLSARKPEDLETDDGDNCEKAAVKFADVQQTGDKMTDAALREILESVHGKGAVTDTSLTIPLVMRNKVPDGFETDDRLDVTLRPDEATEEDYEKVPIEQFGLAMLRGMGWTDGDGVGRTHRVVKPLVPVVRPKGLGLGADKSVLLQTSDNKHKHRSGSTQEDELVLKRGSYCMLIGGKHDAHYGTVIGIDEDNARVMVSLAVGSSTTTVSQYAIKLVSKVEYDKFSKYLNKGKVDRYREKLEKDGRPSSSSLPAVNGVSEHSKSSTKQSRSRNETEDDSEHETKHHRHRKHQKTHSEEKHRERKEHRHKSGSKNDRHSDEEERRSCTDTGRHHDSKHRHSDKNDKHQSSDGDARQRKRKQDLSDGSGEKKPSDTSSSQVWLRPNLRVRIVDENYRRGKYYKTKVTVIDVINAGSCICRTDDSQVLDDLSQSQLETVIPHDGATHVMIVSGKHRTQLAQLLERDKEQCQAVVQLLSDRDVAVALPFDAICEYAADVSIDSFDY